MLKTDSVHIGLVEAADKGAIAKGDDIVAAAAPAFVHTSSTTLIDCSSFEPTG
jgi:hypothetical protein